MCYYIKRKSPFFECEKECNCITKNCMHLYREKCTCILVRPGYLWSEIFSRKLLKLYGFLWSFFSNSETITRLISIPIFWNCVFSRQIFNLHIMIEWMFDKYLLKTQLHKNDNASNKRIAMCFYCCCKNKSCYIRLCWVYILTISWRPICKK